MQGVLTARYLVARLDAALRIASLADPARAMQLFCRIEDYWDGSPMPAQIRREERRFAATVHACSLPQRSGTDNPRTPARRCKSMLLPGQVGSVPGIIQE